MVSSQVINMLCVLLSGMFLLLGSRLSTLKSYHFYAIRSNIDLVSVADRPDSSMFNYRLHYFHQVGGCLPQRHHSAASCGVCPNHRNLQASFHRHMESGTFVRGILWW